MEIALIVAVGQNNEIGKDNDLLWRIRDDLRLFKQTTNQHVVIHGRKSYESIGKPLPNRTNIVVTRNKNYKTEGAFIVHSLEDALSLAQELEMNNEVFVLGGAEIYKQSLSYITQMHISFVQASFTDADAYFPSVEWKNWKQVEERTFEESDVNQFGFTYKKFVKV